jgi:hypothetical protein
VTEADFYARRYGLTREEALRLIKEASPAKAGPQATVKGKRR